MLEKLRRAVTETHKGLANDKNSVDFLATIVGIFTAVTVAILSYKLTFLFYGATYMSVVTSLIWFLLTAMLMMAAGMYLATITVNYLVDKS